MGEFRFAMYNMETLGDRSLPLATDDGLLSQLDREIPGKPTGGEHGASIAVFLRLLSPGIEVVVQYDDQPPSFGVFQGLRDGNLLLTSYNGYPGLVRLDLGRVNAVSVF